MFDSAKRAFAAFKSAPKVVNVQEAAWSESSMYRGADFPKYNPDSLIGRKGYAVYPKMMTDEQIKAVVRFKRDAITSRQIMFECEHETLSEADNLFRKELSEHIIDQANGSFSDSLNGIMSSMYNGFSLTEKIYQHIEYQGKTWVGIDRLEVKPCDTFYFHVDQYGTVERLTQKFDGKEQELDLAKFIHFVQNPDVDKHYGRSELRECYRAWFSKDMTIKFQNIHLERFAAGFIWAAPKDGKTLQASSPEYTALQSVMSNLQATSAIILPSGIELHVEHPATTDMFERAIAQHDKAIAKALLVPNLLGITEQGTTGSYAQSETQLEAFFWTLEADSKRLEDTINEQLFWELGEQNFGDGFYPRLKFKPLSERRKMEIVKTWTSLVTGKAVEATDTDEKYLREILDFPEKGEPIAQPVPVVDPNAPQNNEQPKIDPETGKPKEENPPKPEAKPIEETIIGKQGISVSAFSRAMKRVDFAVIANKADNSTKDVAYEVAAINSQCVARLVALAEELRLGTAEGHPNDLQKIQYTASEMSQLKAALTKGLKDAWAIGESHAKREVQKAQFSRQFWNEDQLRTEDGKFAPNNGANNDIPAGSQISLASVFKNSPVHVDDITYAAREKTQVIQHDMLVPTQLNIDAATVKAYQEGVGRSQAQLIEVVAIPGGQYAIIDGTHRAAAQILDGRVGILVKVIGRATPSKNAPARAYIAKGAAFAVNDLALQDLAAAYLKQKGYTLAGDISAATQKTIRNILMEGVKVSKSAAETKRAIYKALEADGMLTEEAVVDALGASTVKAANARIETAIRTTSFEAINEARYSFFSDPALNGFVEALEYSAILDDRTTEICSQLNGETYGIDSEVWSTFRPPNHFNCRSLLIPVTINDTWTNGEDPTAMPQKGFGFSKCCGGTHD